MVVEGGLGKGNLQPTSRQAGKMLDWRPVTELLPSATPVSLSLGKRSSDTFSFTDQEQLRRLEPVASWEGSIAV